MSGYGVPLLKAFIAAQKGVLGVKEEDVIKCGKMLMDFYEKLGMEEEYEAVRWQMQVVDLLKRQ